jgi:hypothetical protein
MRNIEEARMLAHRHVLFAQRRGAGVVKRHRKAREGRHPRAGPTVQLIERCSAQARARGGLAPARGGRVAHRALAANAHRGEG